MIDAFWTRDTEIQDHTQDCKKSPRAQFFVAQQKSFASRVNQVIILHRRNSASNVGWNFGSLSPKRRVEKKSHEIKAEDTLSLQALQVSISRLKSPAVILERQAARQT
jgi:hypothetical protein